MSNVYGKDATHVPLNKHDGSLGGFEHKTESDLARHETNKSNANREPFDPKFAGAESNYGQHNIHGADRGTNLDQKKEEIYSEVGQGGYNKHSGSESTNNNNAGTGSSAAGLDSTNFRESNPYSAAGNKLNSQSIIGQGQTGTGGASRYDGDDRAGGLVGSGVGSGVGSTNYNSTYEPNTSGRLGAGIESSGPTSSIDTERFPSATSGSSGQTGFGSGVGGYDNQQSSTSGLSTGLHGGQQGYQGQGQSEFGRQGQQQEYGSGTESGLSGYGNPDATGRGPMTKVVNALNPDL